jgi:ArsR family transcriptional regulator
MYHLVEELRLAQPLVSHHLRVLRQAGLVQTSRYRYWTYYQLRPNTLAMATERLRGLVVETPGRRPRRPC